jgi:two-component system response regulator FlrC
VNEQAKQLGPVVQSKHPYSHQYQLAGGSPQRMAAVGILVVEDDQAIREVTTECLREEGYTVYEAPDGKPALERLRTHPEGLVVLLDLWMPGMDGYAVLQAVAAESPLATRHTYILFSANAQTLPLKVVDMLRRLNVTLLPKPVDLEELLAAVQQAANRLPGPASANPLMDTE